MKNIIKIGCIFICFLFLFSCAGKTITSNIEEESKEEVKLYSSELTPDDFEKWDEADNQFYEGAMFQFYARRSGDIRVAYTVYQQYMGMLVMTEYGYLKDGEFMSYVFDMESTTYKRHEYEAEIAEFAVDMLKNVLNAYMERKI